MQNQCCITAWWLLGVSWHIYFLFFVIAVCFVFICFHNVCVCMMATISFQCDNSLWPSNTIQYHRTWSTLVQVMACCLIAPSHYLNQCSPMLYLVAFTFGQFNRKHLWDLSLIKVWKLLIHTATSSRDQWVKLKTSKAGGTFHKWVY